MPLLRFDLVEGRSDRELQTLVDATHEAVVEAFGVPQRDRYLIIQEHKATRFVVEDTGLGIARTKKIVVLQVTSRRRSQELKQTFYRLLTEKLEDRCAVEPADVVVSIVLKGDDDWSFDHGRAQFLTGEL